MVGQTISHYKVLDKLGEGGMGVVYKAEDTKLGRPVALKFLPSEGLKDDERKGRFLHEARAAAALDHPNICTVYEIDEVDGRLFMAMPFLAGRTLDERIEEGPLPIDETIEIALQLADALGEAHAKGIVHRDVKPSNVMLLEQEDKPVQVKLMDFGLARLSEATRLTREGVQPGTVQYMSPEQISGEKIDHRTDIWSFGVVLYEMIAGRPPFDGAYEQALYYGILNEAPEPLTGLRTGVPLELDKVVEKCLRKQRQARFQSATEVAVDLRQFHDQRPAKAAAIPVQSQRVVDSSSRRVSLRALAAFSLPAVVLLVWLGSLLGDRWNASQPDARSRVVTQVGLDANNLLALDVGVTNLGFDSSQIAVSPDGSRIVYVGEGEDGESRLYLRALDHDAIRAIDGTEGAIHSFFSPDGRSLGFLTNDRVKTVGLSGGEPRVLGAITKPVWGAWDGDGSVYVAENEGWLLSKFPVEGGNKAAVAEIEVMINHRYSSILPGGQWAFADRHDGNVSKDYATILAISLSGEASRTILKNGYGARYVEPGYLVYARRGDLMVVRFDKDRLEVVGEPRRIASQVRMTSLFGVVQVGISSNGVLAHAPGGDSALGRPAWTDRLGNQTPLAMHEAVYGPLDSSPTGDRVAVSVLGGNDYIQIYEESKGETARIRSESKQYGTPKWSWDGSKVGFSSVDGAGVWEALVQEIGSPDAPMSIARSATTKVGVSSWLPGDEKVAARVQRPGYTLISLSSSTKELEPLPAEGMFLGFAPNGKWFSFTKENGDLHVRSMDGSQTFQIASTGSEPVWCSTCSALFFRRGSRIYETPVEFDGGFQWKEPQLAFEIKQFIDTPGRSYDVSPDGQRALAVVRERPLPRDRIVVIQNWTVALGVEE